MGPGRARPPPSRVDSRRAPRADRRSRPSGSTGRAGCAGDDFAALAQRARRAVTPRRRTAVANATRPSLSAALRAATVLRATVLRVATLRAAAVLRLFAVLGVLRGRLLRLLRLDRIVRDHPARLRVPFAVARVDLYLRLPHLLGDELLERRFAFLPLLPLELSTDL